MISETDICGETGEIILGRKLDRNSSDEVTVFASTGVAIQDIAAAQAVYTKAVRQGSGMKIEFTEPLSESP